MKKHELLELIPDHQELSLNEDDIDTFVWLNDM